MTYCRLCLFNNNSIDSTQLKDIFRNATRNLPKIINNYMGIEIKEDDVISKLICTNCCNKLLEFHNFVKTCKESQKILKEKILDRKIANFDQNPNKRFLGSSELESNSESIQDQDYEEIKVFKCKKCPQTFSKQKDLFLHDSRHKVPCKICSILVLPKSMRAHLFIHTDAYKCKDCGLRHTSRATLDKHQKARHNNIKGFLCHICGKQSSCYSSMKRHMGYHSTERPYKCDHCEFTAKSLNIIQVHTLRQHLAERSVCEICAKIFKSQLSLTQHMKRMHQNNGKYMCEFCRKTFIERYSLNKHMKRHLNQRFYECKLCKQEFATVRKLKEHMHTHRDGCVKCLQCGKEFFYKKYLYRHYEKCQQTPN